MVNCKVYKFQIQGFILISEDGSVIGEVKTQPIEIFTGKLDLFSLQEYCKKLEELVEKQYETSQTSS